METGLFIACAALTAACALIAVYFMKAFREKTYDRAAILKTAAGLCFLMIGVLFAAGMSGDKRFAWLVAAGLAFGVLGDLLLAIRFIRPAQHDRFFVSGALSFAVGHWLYIYAMLTKYSVSFPVVMTVGIVGLAAAATYVKSKKADAGRLMVFGSVYMAMVVAMGAVSISAATVSVGAATLLFAVGGVMFPISDSILSAYSFGPDKHFGLNIGVHATYYLAQICIAWSLAFV